MLNKEIIIVRPRKKEYFYFLKKKIIFKIKKITLMKEDRMVIWEVRETV